MAVRRALLSVSDKRGLVDLARGLAARGVEIVSTGGTARALGEAGVPVRAVEDVTGFPEILDGRVKTLHPRVHAAILARPTPEHLETIARHGIQPIDLVVVNLYPFEKAALRPGVTLADAVEEIDVGGPAMVRAAAKNFERVGVVVDPDDYAALLAEIAASGDISDRTRRALAEKAFAHTAAYDAAIAAWLGRREGQWPPALARTWTLARALRYGENPHQPAALYIDAGGSGLAGARQIGGKELSYNNLADADAALRLCADLPGTACAIIKHATPCGAGVGATAAAAFRRALATDRESAFGGIVAFTVPVDGEAAEALGEIFLEVVVAPSFSPDAAAALGRKKNLRLLEATPALPALELRTVAGGVLVQRPDQGADDLAVARVATRREPTASELAALDLAWRVAKHVKSNAIVIGDAGGAVGIGGGQTSRVEAVRLAVRKAQRPVAGCALASDGFFPFRDGVDEAAAAGVTAIVQPGGSVRDNEVIAAADERGVAMLLTGARHFLH